MQIIVYILAAFGIVVLLVVALLLWKVSRFFKGLKQAVEGLKEGGAPPMTVSLVPEERVNWEDEAGVHAASAQFEREGFRPIGDFTVPEICDMGVRAFLNEELRLYGVVYDMEGQGVWSDVVALREGGSLTVSNAPLGGMDERPGHAKLRDKGWDVAQLVRVAKERQHEHVWSALSADRFVGVFERAYAEEMQWRKDRGGPTAEEVKRVAAESGMDEPGDDAVEAVQQGWR